MPQSGSTDQLLFTKPEIDAFIDGVHNNEFSTLARHAAILTLRAKHAVRPATLGDELPALEKGRPARSRTTVGVRVQVVVRVEIVDIDAVLGSQIMHPRLGRRCTPQPGRDTDLRGMPGTR